ncbi:MAG: hypothetical protein ABUS57_07970 [Pseudomonadota bacterium]
MIAMVGHGLNGDDEAARIRAEIARARAPDITAANYFRAFPFKDAAARTAIAGVLEKYGF